jgi:hypothetical protein
MCTKLNLAFFSTLLALLTACLTGTYAFASNQVIVSHPLTKNEVVMDTGGTLGHAAYRMCGYDKDTPIVLLMPDTSACPASLDLATTVVDGDADYTPSTWDLLKDVAKSEK